MTRVLLVDDDPMILLAAAYALREGGFDVRETASGTAALEAVRAEAPDAILCDVMLPDLDGPALLARLRAEPAAARVPVVFLTARTDAADVARLAALDVRGVLAKPFDPSRLAGDLRRLLDG